MKAIGKTDIGKVRKSNQDAFKIIKLSENALLAVVCDGMGGANGGYYASNNTVKVVCENVSKLFKSGMTENQIRNLLEASVNLANVMLFQKSQSTPDLYGMGTTIVAALTVDDEVYLVHAGDSRAYIIDNYGCSQLTKDHSVVQQLIEIGELTEVEAKGHPEKNMITRAIGIEESIELDFCVYKLSEDEAMLICTDGLTNYLDADEIYRTAKQNGYFKCLDLLINKVNELGGSDNTTVVMLSSIKQ